MSKNWKKEKPAPGEPTCEECGCPCFTKMVDEGVGHTEAWGAPHFDSRPVEVSACCEAEVQH